MCLFSGKITSVNSTKIFARSLKNDRQALVYSMDLDTPSDVAMILPIPVAQGTGEEAVKFHALDGYPEFFAHLDLLFPRRVSLSYPDSTAPMPGAKTVPLKVLEVGAFNASFVPTIRDFSRLDAQFRLPDDVWSRLDNYALYGFAVFRLRKGNATVHPMAFDFPTALSGRLFFPTVHIHDGEVHALADFDHELYAQPGHEGGLYIKKWQESAALAQRDVSIRKTKGLVAGSVHVYRRKMIGSLKNEDVIITSA